MGTKKHGPAVFGRVLGQHITANHKVSYGGLGGKAGISGQTIRNWTTLGPDDKPPSKATWLVVEVLEQELGLGVGTLWRALTGDEPPAPLELNPLELRVAAMEAELRSLRAQIEAPPAQPQAR